jgi:2-polyprenyl-3-methyl-5-hydroxy-6-metoxy-1,4-benzoquinol methylase
MSVSEVDARMSDWRDTNMKQNYPKKLGKISKYLDVVKGLLRPEDSLLDVGCGRGFVYEYLGHENYQGIDLSADEVEAATNRFPGVRFEVGDLFSLTGTWDVVLCSRVLMHVAPLDEAIKSLMTAARKRLMLIVSVSTEDTVEECKRDFGRSYFRKISRHTLNSYGLFTIHERGGYALVVYDR